MHGGCHASWSAWQEHAPVYARTCAGYEVHALNPWRGRGARSAAINDDSRSLNMSIADVVDDIEKVARCFDTPPVLIAHSMGGLAAREALHASARHEVARTCTADAGRAVERRRNTRMNWARAPIVGDMDAPWGPPPPDVARQMFFPGLVGTTCRPPHFSLSLLDPRIALAGLRGDALVAYRRRDETHRAYPYCVRVRSTILTPPETGAALAALYGRHTYQLEPAHGHNVLLGEGAFGGIAEDVIAWVGAAACEMDVHWGRRSRRSPKQWTVISLDYSGSGETTHDRLCT